MIPNKEGDLFDGMTPAQKRRYLKLLNDPSTSASYEFQHARQFIEDFWNIEGERTKGDLQELVAQLDGIDDILEELRDDHGWKDYESYITDISCMARCVGVIWPAWRSHKEIEEWEIVGPDAIAVPPRSRKHMLKSKKRKGKKMGKKEVERRNVWVYQPAVALENSPMEIRVTEPGSEKKLLGRLYISKGGLTWCNRNQRFNKKIGFRWEAIAKMLGE